MAEFRISVDAGETLVSYALGSCMGVVAHDPAVGVGGILHFMLPDSTWNPEKALMQPSMFGNTGIEKFIQELFNRGASRKTLRMKLAGGSSMRNGGEFFNIGKRNFLMAKRVLWKNGILVLGEDVGGESSRTIRLVMSTGKVWIKDGSGEREL
jgi:chemotaxis protein CheD